MLERERERVAAAGRRVAAEGLVMGSAGNISERGGELVAITPTGAGLGELAPEQIAVVDLAGRHIEAELGATSELALHLGDALAERSAALMANHGAIAHGPDLDAAISQSLLLEWACTFYWRAAAIGTPRGLDEQQRVAVRKAVTDRGYGTTRTIRSVSEGVM